MSSTDATTHPAPDLLDPATYPRSDELTERCDLVMKGGITSGIIYPQAVCQLATTRRLQRVGGTSAGAIAAGAAAAAELGRDSRRDDAGYARLAALPERLAEVTTGGHTRLFHLFQPQSGTNAIYRLVAVLIGRGGRFNKAARGLFAAIGLMCLLPGLVGIGIPVVLLIGTVWQGRAWGIAAAVILLLVGTVTAIGWSLVQRMGRDLPRNHLGLCSGMRRPGSSEPALTEWLADEFDRIAAKDPTTGPLTFGELAAHDIELAMFTTDLSAGTQNRLPFQTRIWAFDPVEFRELFPERIVAWMIEHGPEARDDEDARVFADFAAKGLHPLPLAEDLPIIVAVRMSLSFPVLLSTVPLHAFDYTRRPPKIVRHRFSDGGITSNFPIHFFDAAMPRHPTFGINLVRSETITSDQSENVSMPDSNRQGILARSHSVETLGEFVAALRNGVQNWADSMQTRVPGYRDRIVAVKHTKTEGGMNLDMDQEVVLRLAERGRYAGSRAERFDFVNHRWVRFRSFLQVLEELIVPAGAALDDDRRTDEPTYREMMEGPPPTSYRKHWNSANGRAIADAVAVLAKAYGSVTLDDQESTFSAGAPSPNPQLQIRPKP
jgi:hypothetical protein